MKHNRKISKTKSKNKSKSKSKYNARLQIRTQRGSGNKTLNKYTNAQYEIDNIYKKQQLYESLSPEEKEIKKKEFYANLPKTNNVRLFNCMRNTRIGKLKKKT